jgi:hypothetical protein
MAKKYLTLNQIGKYEPEMKRQKVSTVARSQRGFLTAYKRAGNRNNLPENWQRKRAAFIARHGTQYDKNPTPRRRLALIAWAYDPEKD